MAHHMLPHIDVQRLVAGGELTHAFLIRDPVEVITSYTKVHRQMTLAETGLPYQVDLFERVRAATGKPPPVVDAKDILLDPRRTLSRLCEALGHRLHREDARLARRARTRRTATGRRTGTRASTSRPASRRIARRTSRCPTICATWRRRRTRCTNVLRAHKL